MEGGGREGARKSEGGKEGRMNVRAHTNKQTQQTREHTSCAHKEGRGKRTHTNDERHAEARARARKAKTVPEADARSCSERHLICVLHQVAERANLNPSRLYCGSQSAAMDRAKKSVYCSRFTEDRCIPLLILLLLLLLLLQRLLFLTFPQVDSVALRLLLPRLLHLHFHLPLLLLLLLLCRRRHHRQLQLCWQQPSASASAASAQASAPC